MNDDFQIDIFKLLGAIWQKALAIFLAGLIGAAAALSYSLFFVNPKYESEVSFFVNNSSVTIGSASFTVSDFEVSTSSQLVSTYLYILKSRTTLEDVISRAEVSYTYEELTGMIKAETVTGTAAFSVKILSEDPMEAELLANTIAEVLPERISEIVDGSSVRIVDYAIVAAHSSSPNYTMNTVIGLLAGVVLTAAIVAVMFIINEMNYVVISSVDELKEAYPDMAVLALIPDMRYAGKKNYYNYSSYYGESNTGSK